MASRYAAFSRSLLSTARASSLRSSSSSSLPRIRSPPLTSPLRQPQAFSFTNPRTFAVLGCTQSLLPLHSVVAAARLTSHLTLNARACSELSQGT